MSRDAREVRDLLAPHDPAAGLVGENAARERVWTRLVADGGPPPPPPRRAPWRRNLLFAPALLVGLGLVVAVILSAGSSPRAAHAATPALLQLPPGPGKPARPALLRLAEAATAQPPLPPGPLQYTRIRAWYLVTAVSGESVESQLEPQELETWARPDGSSRVVRSRDGEVETDEFGPERYLTAAQVSTDPDELRAQLAAYPGLPPTNRSAGVTALTLNTFEALRHFGTLRPAAQAAVWRALADLTDRGVGLEYRGAMTDRAGRRGVAITFDTSYGGLPTRNLLIVDPRTGRLLSYEEILTTDAGKLNVDVPSVLQYEILEASGPVADDRTRATAPSAADLPPGAPPAEVRDARLRVALGVGDPRAEADALDALTRAGWTLGRVTRDDAGLSPRSAVVYAHGSRRRARRAAVVANALGLRTTATAPFVFDFPPGGIVVVLRDDATRKLAVLDRRYETAPPTLPRALATVRRHLDLPVAIPSTLPAGTQPAGPVDLLPERAGLALELPDERVLFVTYGIADFDGCGPAEPEAVDIAGVPGIYGSHAVVWPAATPEELPGRYGLAGNFTRAELVDWARAMSVPTADAIRRQRNC